MDNNKEELFDSNGCLNMDAYVSLPFRNNDGQVGSVFGPDNRKKVVDTTVPPYHAIVRLLINDKKGTYRGTGFMIGKDIMLTAGHNLYDFQDKLYADEIQIFRGDAASDPRMMLK